MAKAIANAQQDAADLAALAELTGTEAEGSTTEGTEDNHEGGDEGHEEDTSEDEADGGFQWESEEEVGRTQQSKYDWDTYPAPKEVNGVMRFASKTYQNGVGQKTIYGSYKTYIARIAAAAAKAKADNAKIMADNEKLEEGDPARKALHAIPVVPEFTSKEIKEEGTGKDRKVIGVKVIRIK